jgi:hypothetical protein
MTEMLLGCKLVSEKFAQEPPFSVWLDYERVMLFGAVEIQISL